MTLTGNSDEINGYNSVVKNGTIANANLVKAIVSPIGSIVAWLKTFGTAESGTTSSAAAYKLIEVGQNFLTTCKVGMVVYNTSDNLASYIVTVDSNTQLTLAADIMGNTDGYGVYDTPALPDGWVECNGQVLSDADSPYNGKTIPALNGTADGSEAFLRGTSLQTGATVAAFGGAGTQYCALTVCWVMRVK